MQKNLHYKKYTYSKLKKKLKNKNFNQVKKFYNVFIKNYFTLNKKYLFNQEFDRSYILRQIKEIFKKKADSKRKIKMSLIPIGIKDNINTLDLDTKFGLRVRKKFRSGNNARVVSKIIDNTGIIFSKLTCAEFAVHHIDKKKGINPLDKERIAGTSSTGSVVAVAVGALPVAIGTQTAGSILRPSSYCGVIGFKPTYGAIDRIGVLKTNDLSDTVGIISSELEGIDNTFRSVLNYGRDYPWTEMYKKKFQKFKKKKTLKIGFLNEKFKVYQNFDDEVKKEFLITLKKLKKQKIKLVKIKNTKFLENFHENFDNVYHSSLSYYLKNINPTFENISSNLRNIINHGKKIDIKKKMHSIDYLERCKEKFDRMFKNFDFVIIPTTASIAPKINKIEKEDTCLIWTTFGYPTISLPIYNSKKTNLPFGMQIITNKYNDFSLLELSKKISKLLK
jgi:Asp-tRNA(Asn)/Glu-tRNA(Gln) amidotransferase A subunit family amidase